MEKEIAGVVATTALIILGGLCGYAIKKPLACRRTLEQVRPLLRTPAIVATSALAGMLWLMYESTRTFEVFALRLGSKTTPESFGHWADCGFRWSKIQSFPEVDWLVITCGVLLFLLAAAEGAYRLAGIVQTADQERAETN